MKLNYGYSVLGVDYSTPPHEQTQGSLSDASNVVLTDEGLPTGRGGHAKLNSTTLGSRATSFFEHIGSDAAKEKLTSYSTKIALYDSASGEFSDIITGLTSDKMLQWVNFGGKSICVNEGSDPPQYVEDSTTYGALTGSPPTGKTITEWSNRIWFGGDASNPARLTGCALNDVTDYTTTGAIGYVQETIGDASDPITGIVGFFDWLLVGKRNNLYRVYGDPPTDATSISIKPIYSKANDNIGFTSPWAITQIGKDIIYLDGFDIKSLSGIQEFGDVETTSIIPHFRDYLKDTVDQQYLQYTKFFHYKKKKQVWISIPTGASTHFVFVLDYQFRESTGRYSFFPMSGITVTCFGGVENGTTTDMYFGDESGFVRQLDIGLNDDGAAIDRHLVVTASGNSPPDGVTSAHDRRKQFHHTEAFIKPTESTLTMGLSYAKDLMDDAQVRTSGNYSSLYSEDVTSWSGTGVKWERLKFFGIAGRTMSLKWTHNTLNENFVLYPSNINYAPKTTVQIV